MGEEYNRAMDAVRDEMAKAKGGQLGYLGEIVTALLRIRPECAGKIGAEGKTLKGALDKIRARAKGGVAGPETSTAAICEYYGIECADPRRFAVEIGMEMMGATGETTSSVTPLRGAPPSPEGEGMGDGCRAEDGGEARTSAEVGTGETTSSVTPLRGAPPSHEGEGVGETEPPATPAPAPAEPPATSTPHPDPFDLDALLGVM